jgi:ABC-2 type transport system ATP-binding protein
MLTTAEFKRLRIAPPAGHEAAQWYEVTAPTSAAVVASNISKSYGQKPALVGVNISVRPRERLALIGVNGAGKTTLLHLVVGAHKACHGRLLVFGQSPLRPATRAQIGFAPQMLALYPDLTAAENIEFFASLYGLQGDALRQATVRALELCELSARSGERAASLSGGMQRRLNLGCAIAHRPKLLVLDEPTAGVDPLSRQQILATLRTLRHDGTTILLATHLLAEVTELCDRVAVLDAGRLLTLESPQRLEREYGSLEEAVVRLIAVEEERI